MSKRVALIGHCGPDTSYLRMIVAKAAGRDATILAADDDGELTHVLAQDVDLLLLNRELGYGFKDQLGVDLIKRLRAEKPGIKTMLISNHADAQAVAIANGALPGFGKREIGTPRVLQLLKDALESAES